MVLFRNDGIAEMKAAADAAVNVDGVSLLFRGPLVGNLLQVAVYLE